MVMLDLAFISSHDQPVQVRYPGMVCTVLLCSHTHISGFSTTCLLYTLNAVPASSDCNNMEAEPADDADFHNIRAVYFCNAIIQLA